MYLFGEPQVKQKSWSTARRNNPFQAMGIPANNTSSINWLYYILLFLPLSALVGWLIFRKRYATAGTTVTKIKEFDQEEPAKKLTDGASTCAVKDNEEVEVISPMPKDGSIVHPKCFS